MKPPLELDLHVPRVGPKNRPSPLLAGKETRRSCSFTVTPLRPYQKTLRQLAAIIKRDGGPAQTTVLVATLAKDVLAEERPLPPFIETLELLNRTRGWNLDFYLYCIVRRASTVLAQLGSGHHATEVTGMREQAKEMLTDGGGD